MQLKKEGVHKGEKEVKDSLVELLRKLQNLEQTLGQNVKSVDGREK